MKGYYRYPTIRGDQVIFVSEDDLWSVHPDGGTARRLTANLGAIAYPSLSPDGQTVAFVGREEGTPEVYVMPSVGGPLQRLTYLGANTNVLGWTPCGSRILLASNAGQPVARAMVVQTVARSGGPVEVAAYGPAMSLSLRADGACALGRNNNDPARWKRYRGGTAGQIWVDGTGAGQFQQILRLRGNMGRPMWVGDRLYFLSDHEGIGNIYSCTADGEDVARHTNFVEYYVRFPSTDGTRIVFHAGADLYLLDTQSGDVAPIPVECHSPRVHRQRRFVDAAKYLHSAALHPKGHSLALAVRGAAVTLGNWEGPVSFVNPDPTGRRSHSRTRLPCWLADGDRLVAIVDENGSEAIEVHAPGGVDPKRLGGLDIGRVSRLVPSPTSDRVAITNHRGEIACVDIATGDLTTIERNEHGEVGGLDWSADGNWLAWASPITPYTTAIKLWNAGDGSVTQVTEPTLRDSSPSFDPDGKYLYFIGERELNPVYDGLHFDLGFPKGARPYLITLRADITSPFMPAPKPLDDSGKPEPPSGDDGEKPSPKTVDGSPSGATGDDDGSANDAADSAAAPKPTPLKIDLDGIASRVLQFPVPEGRYSAIVGIKGKALILSFPVQGALGDANRAPVEGGQGCLETWDFNAQTRETVMGGLTGFVVNQDRKTMLCRSGERLRVLKAGAKPDEKGRPDARPRATGWIDLARVRVEVDPGAEWAQMGREAWMLQKDHFWTEDMSGVDWNAVWDRYQPLLDRVNTRGEFSDLMWEMQGELGTSHAYEMGGDYRSEPSYPQGFLGADIGWEPDAASWTVRRIIMGTPGEPESTSPLAAPGVGIAAGDCIVAVNGVALSEEYSVQQALTNQAGVETGLTVCTSAGDRRTVVVKTLRSEARARYRDWVEANRRRVHEATGGRVGYVHIPDMGAHGYAEFHRLYLSEVACDALIVDVRYNGGGHVSELLIEKLARRRVGYDIPRWGQPAPYPSHSVAGPMVAITNQDAGSDGDIFSHVFKLKKLGTLIGTRTWGGVIGISPRNRLVDSGVTTQPEYSFWFMDVGWGVENYGTDPDVVVDIAPQDFAAGRDPQMETAITLILEQLAGNPPLKPAFDDRPRLPLPTALP